METGALFTDNESRFGASSRIWTDDLHITSVLLHRWATEAFSANSTDVSANLL